MKKLLCFLMLLFTGWSSSWAVTYPHTWDFSDLGVKDGNGQWVTINYTQANAQQNLTTDGTYWGTQVPGTDGLQFFQANKRVSLVSGSCLSMYVADLFIADLKYGHVVRFYTNGAGTITPGDGNIGTAQQGGEVEFTIPDGYTSATQVKFSIGASAQRPLQIYKIEVERSVPSFNSDVCRFNLANGGQVDKKSDFNAGAVTVEYDEVASGMVNPRIVIRTGTIAALCGKTNNSDVNIGDIYSNFYVSSSDANVFTVEDGPAMSNDGKFTIGTLTKHNAGTAKLYITYNGNDCWAPYTMEVVITLHGSQEGPYLVWATQLNYNESTGEPVGGSLTGGSYRGSYYGYRYYATGTKPGETEPVTGKDNIWAGYGNNIFFQAFAFKSAADIPSCFVPIPGQERTYWIKDKNWRPNGDNATLFWNNDWEGSAIQYSDNNPAMTAAHAETRLDGKQARVYTYVIKPDFPSPDSLEVYAEIPGAGSRNPGKISTRVLVEPGRFHFKIVPDEGVVNEGCWIIPYVKIPDSRLDDFDLIWATVDNATAQGSTVYVQDGNAIYNGDVNSIGDYIEWKWSEPDQLGNQYKIITGIFPKIYGITAGEEADVTIHIRSKYYYDSEATYHVKVIAQGGDLFHWEMNDVAGADDREMKTITMIEGDFIHMPGIVGNPNGNDEYSAAESYAYVYSIQNGQVVANRDAYFYREGIANYYLSDSPTSTTPLIPRTGDDATQVAYIFKEIGLGNYYRNDTVMIYGNKPGTLYLQAEDAQTGYRCTPIKLVVKSRADLLAEKAAVMNTMTYPYTWDFEHIDMTDIINDATNGGENGNGGSYWRKRWDKDPQGVQFEKDYYQWNAAFNADHDDKDNNYAIVDGKATGLRQRWFKDVVAGGHYMRLFNGLMFNIAGLDYWEQKYTRFNVREDGTCIYLEGGPHYIAMPGFGLTGSATVQDGTRALGSVRMPGLHNQINTIDNNCYEEEFATTYSNGTYTPTSAAQGKKNEHVKLVICAEGRRDYNTSVIYVGGKDMISTANGMNTLDSTKVYKTIHLETKTKRTYIIDINPWDPRFQDQIYLDCDNDVILYWMGISTEPRDMRDDYEVATYSYPKDIDMEKTNLVMAQWVNTGDETGVNAKYPDTDITSANGMGVTGIGFKAYSASAYNSSGNTLTISRVPHYKFGAHEGVLLYPDLRVRDIDDYQTGGLIVSKTVPNKTVLNVVTDNEGNPITDENNNYVYESSTYDYTYYYLPVYFIANAENMNNYDQNPVAVQDGVARGKEDLLNANDETKVNNDDPDIPANGMTNKLSSSAWSTSIPLDFVEEDVKWIPLGLTNEYIGRYIDTDEYGVQKLLDDYLSTIDGEQFNNDGVSYYYDLIGPSVVRFYRANKAGIMKGRRSYLTLTWKEYNVDTYGKDGVANGEEYTANVAKSVRIVFDGEEDTDAITERDLKGVTEMSATGNGEFYNLNGVRVNSLTKGIYIHNGKKIIVK